MRTRLAIAALVVAVVTAIGVATQVARRTFEARTSLTGPLRAGLDMASTEPQSAGHMSQTQLVATIRYFRKLGFLAKYKGLSDDKVATKLKQFQAKEWDTDTFPQGEHGDLAILRWDADRVWWEDTEADVAKGSGVYVETLKDWGKISRGAFVPTRITETWGGERGPIRIEFVARGKTHTLRPRYHDDWLDMTILIDLNRIIKSSDYRFEMYAPFDQTAFVVVLTPADKRKLERERHWFFAW